MKLSSHLRIQNEIESQRILDDYIQTARSISPKAAPAPLVALATIIFAVVGLATPITVYFAIGVVVLGTNGQVTATFVGLAIANIVLDLLLVKWLWSLELVKKNSLDVQIELASKTRPHFPRFYEVWSKFEEQSAARIASEKRAPCYE
jgi:predicted membrane metal-binding protein